MIDLLWVDKRQGLGDRGRGSGSEILDARLKISGMTRV